MLHKCVIADYVLVAESKNYLQQVLYGSMKILTYKSKLMTVQQSK